MIFLYYYQNLSYTYFNFCILINQVTYSSSNTFLYYYHHQLTSTIYHQLKNVNLLWSILRLLTMVVLVWTENEQDQDHIFQETYY